MHSLLLFGDNFRMEDHRSVPTRTSRCAEHLVIDVGSAVPQHLVEGIPVSHAPGLTQIDLGKDDLLPSRLAGPATGHPV